MERENNYQFLNVEETGLVYEKVRREINLVVLHKFWFICPEDTAA